VVYYIQLTVYSMVNVSNYTLPQSVRSDLYKQLLEIIVGGQRRQSQKAFTELLTDAELIQLAKRLAIIVMLARDVPEYRVQKLLYVSPATVHSHNLKRRRGDYADIEQFVRKKDDREELLDMLDTLLRAGLPFHYASRNKWKWLDEIQ